MNENYRPCSFEELNLSDSDPSRRMQPEDIASYAYPPGHRERYTASGLKKAQALGLVPLDVRDFGAQPDNPPGDA